MSRSVQLCPTCGGENCDGHRGVPPGSGGVALWRCLDDRPGCVCRLYVQRFCMACFRPEHIGVRFPADEKDAGRWYRI